MIVFWLLRRAFSSRNAPGAILHTPVLLLVVAAAPAIGARASVNLAASCGREPRSGVEAQSLFDTGLENLRRARYEQAIEAFRRAIELNPNLLLAWYDLGVSYFALQKFAPSRLAFEEVRRRDPRHLFAVYFLARIDLVEGNLDSAIRGFEALAGEKHLADELYYLGVAYFRKGDTPQAIRVLERAVAWKPEDYRAALLLARAYQRVGRASDAEKEYALSEKLRASYQGRSRAMIECQGLLQGKDLENAVERCRQLLDGDDPTKLTSLGTLLAGHQLYDQAVIPLEKAARLDPENYEPQFNLGLTYFKMRKYREARRPLEAALALRPESYDAVALLGSVLFALGEDLSAVEQLRHAHQLRPTDEKVETLLFEELRIIAQHFLTERDYKQAIPFFEEALALKPEAAELRSQLSQAYAALDEKARADRQEKAEEKGP